MFFKLLVVFNKEVVTISNVRATFRVTDAGFPRLYTGSSMTTSLETKSISDRTIIDYLRRVESCTISDLVEFAGVTATAIRQRLKRMMDQDLIVRKVKRTGRGRPTHRYFLSSAGSRSGGDNYKDLAAVLWTELRAVENPDMRRRLLQRVVDRMAEIYRDKVKGSTIHERMQSVADLMQQYDVPFEVESSKDESQLPILKALACPYPDLAEQDRAVCSMEKMLFSEILGETVRLSTCRLDGAIGCTFELASH